MKKLVQFFLVPLIFFGTLLRAEVPNNENVTRLYVATFNRAPDAAGLEYWVNQSHLQLEQIAQSFFDQPETQEKYPAGTSDHDFVKAVYNNLFNRDPDSGGWQYWERELQSGRVPKPVFILAVINGAQDTQEYGLDRTILQNKKEVGLYFVQSGLNDVNWAKEVMADVTAEVQSVADAKVLIDQWREEAIRENSPLVLSVMTQLNDRYFENALASNALCTVGLSGLNSTEVKVRVNTQHGVTEVTPVSVSVEKQEIIFEAPANVRDGNLSIVGKMIRRDTPYRTVSAQTPYIERLEPNLVKAGEEVVVSGKNLPSVPVALVFEGQDSSFTQTVIPAENRVAFTVPQGVGSGNIYLKIAQIRTNSLYLSVKRTIDVSMSSEEAHSFDPSDISFVLGLEEHRLDADFRTSLDVENETIQYLHAMVTLADDEAVLLYSTAVLPDMTDSINIDANSTAIAWILMGMGAGTTIPKDELRALYDHVGANSEVQAFADYIDSLQKTDFDAWATRSDETLKIKFQEALQSVIESVSANGLHAQLKERSISSDTVVVTQNPENNNIYADKEKLDRGSITIVNDTKLYLSVEVRSNHPERKGEIVGGYYHAANAVLTDGGTLIGPQQWGLLDIASEKKFMLGGEDSHLEIVTAGFLGETDRKKLSDSLRARVMLEGIAIPSLNMLLTTVLNMQIANGYKANHFVEAMRLMYVNGDFLKQLMTEISTENSHFAAIVDTFVIKPVVNGLKGCFQPETSDICNATVGGLAKLIGISGSTEYVKNKIIFKIESNIGKSALKKTLVAIPVVGWIAEAAVFVYDNMPYISNASTFIKSSMDMKHNPKEINVDVDFPLEISCVIPLCVAQGAGETIQSFQIKGKGFAEIDGNGPEVSIGILEGKIDAFNVAGSVTDTDLTAEFNMDELLTMGSREEYLSVKNLGYSVYYPELIRMVSFEDQKIYLDTVSPKRVINGDTLIIRGCGWVPLNEIEVIFPSKGETVQAEILSKTIDEISVKVPQNAVSGIVHVKTGMKDASFFLPIDVFALSSASTYRLEDKKNFTVNGKGLGTTAHLYFIDVNGKRYEGSIGNITDTGIWVNEPPANLPVGKVQVYVVLENGSESNRLMLVQPPKPPMADPESTNFAQSILVSLSQETGADIYYRVDDNIQNNTLKYSEPLVFNTDMMTYETLYLYAFSRVTIDGVNYDSDIVEFIYTECDGEINENGECIPGVQCPATSADGVRIQVDDNLDIFCMYYPNEVLWYEEPKIWFQIDDILYHRWHGIFKEYYDNGNRKHFTTYVKGIKEGMERWYYTNGQIYSEFTNKNNIPDGVFSKYTDDGQLLSYTHLKNGIKDGLEILWDSQHIKLSETVYRDGKKDGLQTLYASNGNIESQTYYIADIKNGIHKVYDTSTGVLRGEYNYLDGKLDGLQKSYNANGSISSEIYYVQGIRNGVQKSYDEQGVLKAQVNYVDGEKNGIETRYYTNSNIEEKIPWEHGVSDQNGIHEYYYFNGQLKLQNPYKNGELDGTVVEYYDTGEKKRSQEYEVGELNGISKWYYANGIIQKSINYKDGVIDGMAIRYDTGGEVIECVEYDYGQYIRDCK